MSLVPIPCDPRGAVGKGWTTPRRPRPVERRVTPKPAQAALRQGRRARRRVRVFVLCARMRPAALPDLRRRVTHPLSARTDPLPPRPARLRPRRRPPSASEPVRSRRASLSLFMARSTSSEKSFNETIRLRGTAHPRSAQCQECARTATCGDAWLELRVHTGTPRVPSATPHHALERD